MFMHKSKKGFTIVELVIVIAVIAILAAVLIPTFSNLVKKANQSADIQAARQMNTVLAAEGAVEKNNIFEVFDALAANGMTAKDYKPLATDHYFFWDDEADRIVYTDKNYQVLFPADLEADGDWFSLNAKIPTSKPADYVADNAAVTVASAEEYAYVVEQFNSGKHTAGRLEIDLNGAEIDMKGANITLYNNKDKGKIEDSSGNFVIKNGTIKNISSIDVGHAGNGGEHEDGKYYAGGLFASLGNGNTVTISNITVENAYIKSATTSSVGILIGSVGNKTSATIENVTIKNSTVIGYDNVGALVGNSFNAGGPGTIEKEGVVLKDDIELDNVQVRTAAGRSGLLIGFIYGDECLDNTSSITLKNGTSYDIYECDLNTGSGLGLQGEELKSINVNGETEEHTFFAGAYATTNNGEYQDWSTGQAPIGEYKYTGNGFSGVTVE